MRQWSQVGHSKKRKISREELEKWSESLNALLASQSESCFILYSAKHFLEAEIPLMVDFKAFVQGSKQPFLELINWIIFN